MLVHGLGGDESGTYMATAAHFFLQDGYAVFRMNMRGVGASATTSEGPYHAGLTADLRAVLEAIANVFMGPISLLGFSLGGHQVLKLASEGNTPASLTHVLAVSAPLNLAAASKRIEALRNRPYRAYLTKTLKDQLKQGNWNKGNVKPNTLRSVLDIDHRVVAPAFGYQNAFDYYEQASVWPHIENIKIPTLAVHASNDPWIPVQDYYSAEWPDSAPVGALLTPDGGHVGFHVRGQSWPWYLPAFKMFLDTSLRPK